MVCLASAAAARRLRCCGGGAGGGAVVPCVSPYYILFYSMFNLIYLGINPRAHKGLRARREALLNVWYPITVSPYYMYGKSVKKEVED